MGKNRIIIDYAKCGENGKVDPRNCGKCLRACDPAILLMHETLGIEQDSHDPQSWRITAMWTDLCTRCMRCKEVCPERAISISW